VFFNHASGYEMPHMILAAYMVSGFTVAGVYAAGILRGRRDRYRYTGFALGFIPAAILTPVRLRRAADPGPGLAAGRVRAGDSGHRWDSVPPADRPQAAWLIHLCFDVMVGLGAYR
jgi:cytochrome bd ubiquinol oxidase subunit I